MTYRELRDELNKLTEEQLSERVGVFFSEDETYDVDRVEEIAVFGIMIVV